MAGLDPAIAFAEGVLKEDIALLSEVAGPKPGHDFEECEGAAV